MTYSSKKNIIQFDGFLAKQVRALILVGSEDILSTWIHAKLITAITKRSSLQENQVRYEDTTLVYAHSILEKPYLRLMLPDMVIAKLDRVMSSFGWAEKVKCTLHIVLLWSKRLVANYVLVNQSTTLTELNWTIDQKILNYGLEQ